MEFVFSSLLCLLFVGIGFAAGLLVAGRRTTAPMGDEERAEKQERLDRQWDALFQFDGRND